MKNPKPASLSSELLSRDEDALRDEENSSGDELSPEKKGEAEIPVSTPHVNGTASSDMFAHQRERVAQLAAELKSETPLEGGEAELEEAIPSAEALAEPSTEVPPAEPEHAAHRVTLGDWVERAPRREEKERAALMSEPHKTPKTESATTPRSVVMLLVVTGVAVGTAIGLALGGAFDGTNPQAEVQTAAGTPDPARGIEVSTLPPPGPATVAPEGSKPAEQTASSELPTVPTLSVTNLTGYGVQLSAVESEAAATKVWDGLAKRHAALLADHPHEIVQTVVGGRTYFRVRAGEFAKLDDARALCKALKAKDQACLVIKRS